MEPLLSPHPERLKWDEEETGNACLIFGDSSISHLEFTHTYTPHIAVKWRWNGSVNHKS